MRWRSALSSMEPAYGRHPGQVSSALKLPYAASVRYRIITYGVANYRALDARLSSRYAFFRTIA